MESEGSLPHSQVSATCPDPEPARSSPYSHTPLPEDPPYQSITSCPRLFVWMFRRIIRFYGEELLALRPNPKLEDHPLSAVRDCLVNIFAANLHIGGRSSIRKLRTRHALEIRSHLSRKCKVPESSIEQGLRLYRLFLIGVGRGCNTDRSVDNFRLF
jgi:hypothetical protein